MKTNETMEKFIIILERILKISKTSYEQEVDREKQLLTKSDYLIKYISVIFGFINIFLPLIFKYEVINLYILIIMYVITTIPLIITLYYSIKSQSLKKAVFFPTGKSMLEKLKTEMNNYCRDDKLINKEILYYSNSTEELQKSNDKRSNILKRAYTNYFVSIMVIALMIFILMIIIA